MAREAMAGDVTMFPRKKTPRVGDVVTLTPTTDEGRGIIALHGERWLVREIDHSVLSRNLGLLVCPASYVGSEHLSPKYDTPRSIAQADGFSMWTNNEYRTTIGGEGHARD